MDLNSTIPLAIAAALLAEVYVFKFQQCYWPNVVIVVCSFVSLVQTNLGTKSVCSLATKRSNGFGHTNLDNSRSYKIEKNKNKNGFGPFSYKFFVPIRVGLNTHLTNRNKKKTYK